MPVPERLPVAVLGATGLVGRRLVHDLEGHPWFEVKHVAASDRTAGRPYGRACRSRSPAVGPELEALIVQPCDPSVCSAPLVFSALDPDSAREIEPAFARAGALVVSNASAHRQEADVPLLIPEVNAGQLSLLRAQRGNRGWSGGIICNPNCVVAVVALALHPLFRAAGIQRLEVTTLQAVSGAGHPGLSSVEILGNVIPWIGGEEEKIRREAALVLGREFPIGVQVNRVPVMHGHLASLVIECDRELTEPELRAIYTDFAAPPDVARLPTSPPEAVVLVAGEDRPQPLLDVDQGRGMTVSVGRLRVEGSTVRLVALGHNLVRGAAGAAVLNAELAVSQGYLASPAGKPASGWRHLSRVDRTSPPPSIRSHP